MFSQNKKKKFLSSLTTILNTIPAGNVEIVRELEGFKTMVELLAKDDDELITRVTGGIWNSLITGESHKDFIELDAIPALIKILSTFKENDILANTCVSLGLLAQNGSLDLASNQKLKSNIKNKIK